MYSLCIALRGLVEALSERQEHTIENRKFEINWYITCADMVYMTASTWEAEDFSVYDGSMFVSI